MAAEQRKLLEQLMGASAMVGGGVGGGGRGGRVDERGRRESDSGSGARLDLTDSRICRGFLLDACPYDLIGPARPNMGTCPRLHSQPLRMEFEHTADTQRSPAEKRSLAFEYEVERELAKYVDEMNRRVDVASKRLERTSEEEARASVLLQEMGLLERDHATTLSEVRVLGRLGLVARAIDAQYDADKLAIDRDVRLRELHAIDTRQDDFQKLEICTVCSAFLSKLDNDRRLADHFGGKAHLAYARLRRAHARLKDKVEELRNAGIEPPSSGSMAAAGPGYRSDRRDSSPGSTSQSVYSGRRSRNNNNDSDRDPYRRYPNYGTTRDRSRSRDTRYDDRDRGRHDQRRRYSRDRSFDSRSRW
ncbi:splicing factor [Savitreella phatthalungensis]